MKRQYLFINTCVQLVFCAVICVPSLFVVFSCKKTDSVSAFYVELKSIDSQISSGEKNRALASLQALSKSAKDAKQVLAVSKRMLSLDAMPQVIKFLQSAVSTVAQDSPEVAGLLIATLIDAGRVEGIEEYAPLVKNSSYSSLIAEASLLTEVVNDIVDVEPYSWEVAYRLTGEQSFLKMSALSLCKDGKLSKAEFLKEAIPKDETIKDPFFWSCLSYDLGHFDFLFKHVNVSIENAEREGVFETGNMDVDKASRHLLLAADAAYSTGDIDIARSYWQECADLPRPTPIALYNLALTSESEEEKSKYFVECITRYPFYYPAISSYIRQYLVIKSNEISDEVTQYLADRGFYSMRMEEVYLSIPNMVYSPETLLNVAISQPDHDPRIALEYFRYKHYQGINFRAGIADMWKLLEDYPDNADVLAYAKWYFSHCRDFNACFSVGNTGDNALDAFYLGLEKAVRSSTDDDIIESFNKASAIPEYRVFATANIAYVYYQQGLKDKAVETLSVASSMTDDDKVKSKFHYQAARILSEIKSYDRAISVAGYAVELDEENYPAQVLLEKLKSLK